MLETLSEDYVRTARAKGLPLSKVYAKHALRAAITPIVTIAGLDIGASLGGTFITETIFGLRGLGKETVEAVQFPQLADRRGYGAPGGGVHRRGQPDR